MNNLLNNTYVTDVTRKLISLISSKDDVEVICSSYHTACDTLSGMWIANACDNETYYMLRDEISKAFLSAI